MPTIVQCAYCNNQFPQDTFKAKRNRINFCSKDCQGSHWARVKAERTVSLTCDHCGKPFERMDYEVKRSENNFCTYQCSREFLKRMVPVSCEQCGKQFERAASKVVANNHTFCSYACDFEWRKKRKTAHCLNCNSGFTKRLKEVRKYDFCSLSCYREWNEGEKSPAWQGGLSFDPYPKEFNNRLKRKIRARDNYHCQVCGKSQSIAKRALDVHHINYDKSDCREANLIATCNSCNIRVNTKRTIWRVILSIYQRARGIS